MRVDVRKVAWPIVRRATAYQMQRWALSVSLDALRMVLGHARRLRKVEQDWLVDVLVPVSRAVGYPAVRETTKYTLATLRKPLKRFAPLVEEMLLDDKLPGQMRDAALDVAQVAFRLVEKSCPADVCTAYAQRQLEWLAICTEDVNPGDVANAVATREGSGTAGPKEYSSGEGR